MEKGRYVLKMLHRKKRKTKPKNTAMKPLKTKKEAQKESSGDFG